jgi:hypothetical protein
MAQLRRVRVGKTGNRGVYQKFPCFGIAGFTGRPAFSRLRQHRIMRAGHSAGFIYPGWGMSDYRAYFLDDNGHVLNRYDMTCETDEQAITQARTLANGHDIEVWQLDRVIGKIPKTLSRREV